MVESSSSSSSSSSYPTACQEQYDVFLSFRGEDTRKAFTSHLYHALVKEKILTFIDNDLVRGEEISPSLLEAIDMSKISIVVLSENYASSKWCLEELVKILECKRNKGQTVIPLFYGVDPSHVRNQTGSFQEPFVKYEESLNVSNERVQIWRSTLKEVANLSGLDSSIFRSESELVEEILNIILKNLKQKATSYSSKGLVGMESQIRGIKSLLSLELSDVRTVGIWGMGGLGKTTLTRAIYDQMFYQFDSCCFLSNASEQLQDKLFSALLEKESTYTSTHSLPTPVIWDRLRRKKVLIVVDDADDSRKLHDLLKVGEPKFFGSGSRILVTSRDVQVLKNVADEIYTMEGLGYNEALHLFSLFAFKQSNPPSDRMLLQSEEVINYAKGNPLALKILGSALFGRSEEEWKSALGRLQRIPNQEICNVLKTSYDGLDSEEQNIFLDITCFFKGRERNFVAKVLDGCYGSADAVINTLIDRSIITISNGYLELHDLLQEMGKRIVIDESRFPENRSRLCSLEDVCQVLKENRGTGETIGISLDLTKASEICLKPDSFTRMCHLRILNFYWSRRMEDRLKLSRDGLESLSNELRYLHWSGCPIKSLPSNFSPENLVVLELLDCKVKKLWTGTQDLVKLKEIDLSWSKYLTKIPDLSKATNIEKIDLRGCRSLEKVHPSIQYLNKLEFLRLSYCDSLRRFPKRIDSKALKTLSIKGCPKAKKCLDFQWNDQLKELHLDCNVIKDVPSTISSIQISSALRRLYVYNCSELSSLPSSFNELKSLKSFHLMNWSELESLPDIFEHMNDLEWLKIRYCRNLKRLPPSIFNLESLTYLDLRGSAIKEMPSSIEYLSCLGSLSLNDCKYLETLPSSIHNLPELFQLKLNSCDSLRSLPKLPPSLTRLIANNCKSLQTLSIRCSEKYSNHLSLKLANCLRLCQRALKIEVDNLVSAANFTSRLHLLYPGSEVPEGFSNQSMGSSVTIQFPPSIVDQFEAIYFCVVFEFKKPPLKNFSDFSILAKADHVLIWRDSLNEIKKYSGTVSLIDLYVTHSAWHSPYEELVKIAKHLKVKKCGFQLVQKPRSRLVPFPLAAVLNSSVAPAAAPPPSYDCVVLD